MWIERWGYLRKRKLISRTKELDPLHRSPVVSLVKGAVCHPVEMKKIQFQMPSEAIKRQNFKSCTLEPNIFSIVH